MSSWSAATSDSIIFAPRFAFFFPLTPISSTFDFRFSALLGFVLFLLDLKKID